MAVEEGDIIEIRRLYGKKGWTYRSLGEKFGIHHSTVARIINTCDPVASDAPSKVRARRATQRDKSDTVASDKPDKMPKGGGTDPKKSKALIAGAKNEADAIMMEFDRIYQGQASEVAGLMETYNGAKKNLLKPAKLKDEMTVEIYGEPVYSADGYQLLRKAYLRYKDLPEDCKYKVDMKLPDYAFNKYHNIFMRLQKAMEMLQDTLQRMAHLQKNITLYFDGRQQTIIQVCPRCQKSLPEKISDYRTLWEKEENIIDIKPIKVEEEKNDGQDKNSTEQRTMPGVQR